MRRGFARFRVIGFVVVVLLIGAAVSYIETTADEPNFTIVAEKPLISIDSNSLKKGDVQFFAYISRSGDKIRFLLARDSTGKIKAAFDACKLCYIYRKGYYFSHGDLVCRYCGNRYTLEAMESGAASCAPIMLPFQMNGQVVTIKAADLEGGEKLF
jgi:uncharacterized membrane protein